tara:strand:+ start:3846 stop:4022 length:177 start_codon:yes stop_codon:yes gene_type:complete
MTENRLYSIYDMVENIWDGILFAIVAIMLSILVFKTILMPTEANIFQINQNSIHTVPL